jgi:hypothetical protein
MKKLLVILSLISYTAGNTVLSQEYKDLLILYVDENYEKCFGKALKYTENEKSKTHPLPYLYVSMASFGMSQDHQYSESWPKAYSTALSFAKKYRKKDPDNTYAEDSQDYIDQLKEIIYEDVENYMLTSTEKGYKKAAGILKKVCAFDPKDSGARLLWGELEILTKNKTEGKKIVSQAINLIKTIGKDIQFGDLTEIQQKYLRKSLMEYALFIDTKDPAKAIEIISIGQPFFYEEREDCLLDDNEEFKKLYDKITG